MIYIYIDDCVGRKKERIMKNGFNGQRGNDKIQPNDQK